MSSMKGKIKFNKVRNNGEKIKRRLRRKRKDNMDKPKKNKKKFWYIVLSVITFMAIAVIICVILFGAYIVLNAPEFKEELLFNKDSSIIYDKNGETLAVLGINAGENQVEKRIKLTYDEIPEVMVDALIATEDSRFFQHNGVDVARFLKASVGQALGNSGAGGASTLTMQVSKNALTDTTSSGIKGIIRKFTDIYLSVFKIEKAYTKQDIIEMYLNSEFLGNQSYGIEQASKTYFGKSASDLSLSEAAMIAGLFQAPSSYDPYAYPEKAEARRNQVLSLMVRHGYISEEEAKIAKAIPVTKLVTASASNVNVYQGYVDTVVDEVIDKYDVNPYKVPLEIYTYFDKDKQNVINSIYNGAYGYQFKDEKVQLAVAVIDNSNGALIAVGARRQDSGELGYNYATMIKRHPGSTIKPILDYGPAFEYLNWSTATPIFDEETTYTSGGVVSNWDREHVGLTTVKNALSKSMNTAALQTFRATTNEQKWQFANSLGIEPGNSDGKIFESASIGAFEGVNPVQLAGAYSAFATGGIYTEPHSVQKIVYKESGDTDEKTYESTRVMKPTTAFLITNILFNVTPGAARISGTDIATKTGTSSYDTSALRAKGIYGDVIQDSWTAFYNPEYTISTWYGYDELSKEYNTTMGNASTQRNKIESLLTKNIMNTGSRFSTPKGITPAKIELETIPVKLASEFTPEDLVETHYFISGTEPTEVSTRFSKLADPTNLNVVEKSSSATLTWEAPELPNAVSETYLNNYFTTNYKEWAEKYYAARLEYNRSYIGTFGYDVYLKSGSSLKFIDHTDKETYTINKTTNYDSVVVKSSYSLFKANASDGISADLTGSSTKYEIQLEAIKDSTGESYINPTFHIGDTIADMGIKTIKFLSNNVDITDKINSKNITIKIKNSKTNKTVDKIDNTKEGEYEILYTVVYLGETNTKSRTVHIK